MGKRIKKCKQKYVKSMCDCTYYNGVFVFFRLRCAKAAGFINKLRCMSRTGTKEAPVRRCITLQWRVDGREEVGVVDCEWQR